MIKEELDLLETLAELEHQQWMNWAKQIMQKEKLSQETTKRWKNYFIPYKDLPEDIKELDRNYARKVISALKDHQIIDD